MFVNIRFVRWATLVALIAVCMSCSGGGLVEERPRADRGATISGVGACRTVSLEASGTSEAPVVESGIPSGDPVIGYIPRTAEVLWWHAVGAVNAHGRVEFEADEGSGGFDIVAAADHTIHVSNVAPSTPSPGTQLHVRSLSLTWTVAYTSAQPASAPPSIGIRVLVSPFPDGGLNRCMAYTCDPENGPQQCSPQPAGTLCADTNTCNGVETCDGEGACVAGTNVASGTSCSDGNPCNGEEACNGSGSCAPGTAIAATDMDDHNECTADFCDPERGGIVNEPIAACQSDPGAPPLDGTEATTFAGSTAFLYSGPSAVQTGVVPGTIGPERSAVVRGRVYANDGVTPAVGAVVTVLGHPELGQTTTRSDGWYDLAVNGGAPVTIDVNAAGYLRVQRTVPTKWNGYAFADDVVLTPPQTSADTFVVGASTGQLVRGALTPTGIDGDDARRTVVYFPPNTQIFNYPVSNGTPLAVQITEYTRDRGQERMPGELPPTSAYTYAVEVTFPAAAAAGVDDVHFAHPVILYQDNFTSYPVGATVPVGYYDRERGAWLAEESGRIIELITAPSGGEATIDIDGDGVAESPATLASFGIAADERVKLAAEYGAGKTLWRSPVMHFSDWDCNWGAGPPIGAAPPPQPDPNDEDIGCQSEQPGSIIGCESRTLGESIPVVGTPFSLHYQSRRTPGYRSVIRFPLSDGSPLDTSFLRAHVEIEVAGRRFAYTRSLPSTNNVFTWVWDGLDAYGRTVHTGRAEARIRLGYEYSASTTFASPSFGAVRVPPVDITGNRNARTVTLWRERSVELSRADAKPLGFGGWSLDVQHTFDAHDVVSYGNGRRRSGQPLAFTIDTVAGGGTVSPTCAPTPMGDGGPATAAVLINIESVVQGPDGSLYIAHQERCGGGYRVRRVAPDGIISTIAGLPPYVAGDRADGRPALHAHIWPTDLAVAPDGSIVFTERYGDFATMSGQVWRIEMGASPTLRLIAGTGTLGATCGALAPTSCFAGEGGRAILANLRYPGTVAVAKDGTVFFKDDSYRVRRVGPEGTITTYFQSNAGVKWISLRDDGALFVQQDADQLVRVDPTGVTSPVANDVYGDWCLHPNRYQYNQTLALADNAFLVSCYENVILRTTAGAIVRIAGDPAASGFAGDGGPAIRAFMKEVGPIALGEDGAIFIGDRGSSQVRRLRSPAVLRDLGQFRIPSEDGREVYEFSATGSHARTLSGLRGTPLFTFDYDSETKQLTSITDEAGNVTEITRPAGTVRFQGPFGHVTTLTLDSNGYLASVTSPKTDEVTFMTHSASGLLTRFVDANGNAHRFEYDSEGRLTRDVDAAPGSLGQRLSVTRTAADWTVNLTSAEGRLQQFKVDPKPGLVDRTIAERREITDAAGFKTIIDRHLDGAFASTRSSTASATTVAAMAPDPRWGSLASFPTSVTRKNGNFTMTQEEARSTPTLSSASDPFSITGQTITTTLKGAGLPNAVTTRAFTAGPPARWTTTSPAGRQTRETLDNLDRVTEVAVLGSTPVTLHPVQYHYDSRGRIDQITHGARVYTTTYDPATGWVASTTAPEGLGVTYAARDGNGRPTIITLPGARTLDIGYDRMGNMLSITPPSKPSHGFTMTPTDRTASYVPPDVLPTLEAKNTYYGYDKDSLLLTRAEPGQTTTFTYDSAGRTSTIDDGVARIFGYDSAGRVGTITTGDGVVLTNTYDGTLLTQQLVSGPFSRALNRSYDHFRRVTSIGIDANAIAYAHDGDGFVTGAGAMTVNRSTNGLLTGTSLGSVSDTFTYSAYGEVASHSVSGSATAYSVTYTRDGAGRIHVKTETIGLTTHAYRYEYDSAGRLWQVYEDGATSPTREWTYDANGNRDGGTYDAQDRLGSYNGVEYLYGNNGELRSRSVGGAETLFSYDAHGNLRSVAPPSPLAPITYVIDGLNRRIGKKVSGTLVQGFLYDGSRLVAELDGGGNVLSRFVYATGSHSPDFMIKAGVTYRLVKDHLGGPRLVVNAATGAVAQRLDYDEWGEVTADTSPGFQPFGFAGGLWDRDTNLVRFGARDYDPATGRWTSKDPIRFAAGDSNLYGYVANDPLNHVDPTGLYRFNHGPLPPKPPHGPDWHRCRNKRNRCPKQPPLTCPSERNGGWSYGDGGGAKWRSPQGYECAYDSEGNLLPDEHGNYTFNYEPDPWTVRHILLDVIPHFLFGGGGGYESGLTTPEECE